MRPMALRTAAQLHRRRRVERGIRLIAPVLDLVLLVGEHVSRVAGRNDPEPEPPPPARASLGGPPRQA